MPRWPLFFCLAAASALAAEPDSARLTGRYQQMLAANPVEGIALDRLWKMAQDSGASAALLEEYKTAADHFSGAMVYGHLLRKAGRSEEARIAYQKAEGLDPKSALPYLALGQLAMDSGAAREAANDWEKGVALLSPNDPKLTGVYGQIAAAWLAAHESEKASEVLEKMCAQNPDDLALRQRLAELYEKNGLTKKAVPHWEFIAAHGAPAQRAPALQNLARLHQASGEVDAASADLEHALALTGPDHWLRAALQAQLIRLYERFHRTAELEQRWKKQAEENPRDAGTILQLVDFYERSLNTKQERVWLEKLCALRPGNFEDKVKLARVAADGGQLVRVAELLDEVLAGQPENADLVLLRAEIELRQNLVAAALARVEKLWSRASADETLPARLIAWLTANRFFQEVEAHLQEAAGRDENGRFNLANWYFTQNRHEDAQRVLRELAQAPRPAPEQAAELVKIAAIFREHDALDEAIKWQKQAAALRPRELEIRLTLADWLMDAQRGEEAQNEAQQAFAASETEKERAAADEKLFQILQKSGAATTPDATAPRTLQERMNWLTRSNDPEPANVRLQKFVEKLTTEVTAHPTAKTFLRLARWEAWQRRHAEALAAARGALRLDPQSIEAHELAARAAMEDGQKTVALDEWRELQKLEPERKNKFARKIGQLELESAHFDAALKIFTELAAAQPGQAEALVDLALAQQQAGHWTDALGTWQRAVAASFPTKKREMIQPLLRVMERLEMVQPAADFLLKTLDGLSDENSRQELLGDLVALAQRHGLLEWLQTEFQQRQRGHPDDWFTASATAQILQANGHERDALALLAEAAYAAHDEPAALRDLVQKAEALGDFSTAGQFQRRLLALTPAEAAARAKLAELQERDLDIRGATATWAGLVENFPRDAAWLERAADFFQRWQEMDRARAIWRSLRTLDPQNTSALLALAQSSDDSAEKFSCYEQVLQTTPPSPTAHLPRPEFFGDERKTETELGPRWVAIRALAEMIRDRSQDTDQKAWRTRWEKAAAPAEAFWASFYAGDMVVAKPRLQAWAHAAATDSKSESTARWWSWQMHDFENLPTSLSAMPPPMENQASVRRELLAWIKVTRGLEATPLVDALVAGHSSPAILWSVALPLAQVHRFAEAVRLGEPAFAARPTPAESLELAHWLLLLGERAQAVEVLEKILAGAGDSFEQPVYEALRERFLLLPPAERKSYVGSFERRLNREEQPLSSALAMALLHGWQGEETEAQQELAQVLALRPLGAPSLEGEADSAGRGWAFVLATGVQLQAWRLETLAAFFWEKALADPAAIRLQGGPAELAAREIRLRLFAQKLRSAPALEWEILLDDYVAQSGPQKVLWLGAVLEGTGEPASAAALWHSAWHRQPQNLQLLRNLLNASQAAGDGEGARAALTQATAQLSGAAPGARDILLEQVDYLKGSDELKRVLEAALQRRPADGPILAALAGIETERGHADAAEALYRRLIMAEPNQFAHRVALARLLDRTGRTDAALEILESEKNGSAADGLLAELELKVGHTDAAREHAQKVARRGSTGEVASLATAWARGQRTKEGLRWLAAALEKEKEPAAQFELQMKFVELAADEFPELAGPMLARARTLARAWPKFWVPLLKMQTQVAARLGLDEQKLLIAEWDEGRGAALAGEKLIERLAVTHQQTELENCVTKFCARNETDEASLKQAAVFLRAVPSPQLALEVDRVLAERDPADSEGLAQQVQDFAACGEKSAARAALQKLADRTIWINSVAARIAPLCAELGESELAEEMWRQAVQGDPLAHDFAAFLHYAQILRDQGRMGAAEEILQAAFRNPANRDVASLVDFFAAGQQAERLEHELPAYPLSPELLAEARRRLAENRGKEAARK